MGLPPGPAYKELKAGRDVELQDGRVIRSADVVAAPVKGRKLVLLGDTRNAVSIVPHGQGADLLVHEATVEEGDSRAVQIGHSTPRMAGALAKMINCSRLVLTHFSARADRGCFRPEDVHVQDWSPGPPNLVVVDNKSGRLRPISQDPNMSKLVETAARAFGSDSVAAARDFMNIHIPRGGFKK